MGGTDIDLQLLEAAKAGDMELVKVCVGVRACWCLPALVILPQYFETLQYTIPLKSVS